MGLQKILDAEGRLKHHRYNTLKESSFLGVFISTFGWLSFSITIIEVLPQYSDKLLTLAST
jgi:hypothetical protein